MDFKRIISAATIPAVLFVVVGIVGLVLGFLLSTFLSTIGSLVGMILGFGIFVVQCLILLWAGYQAAKKYQLDVVGAAGTGALAAFVGSIIDSIVSLVLSLITVYLKIGPAVAANSNAGVGATSTLFGAAALGGAALICGPVFALIGAVIAAVIGAILGAIGGFLGQGKKK